MDAKQIARFWTHVDRRDSAECWEWRGDRGRRGYGRFTYYTGPRKSGRVQVFAHRAAFELSIRKLSGPDECVCHRCDNPPCCNPEHLFAGTRAENLSDMRAKGRDSKPPIHRGQTHPLTPFSEDDIRSIRCAAANGESQSAIARRTGVSATAIHNIVRRYSWSHIE